MKVLKQIGTFIGGTLILIVVLLLGGEVTESMPHNAVVLADDTEKIFHSPIHFIDDHISVPSGLRRTTSKEVNELEYKADPICRNRDYFFYDRGSILKATLSDLTGLTAQRRWNEDGSWNW